MPRSDDLHSLPAGVPEPVDDGACDHLGGLELPDLALPSTAGRQVRLRQESASRPTVVYCYPRTGTPDRDPPEGWNQRPGARGCTPQALGFRDRHEELRRAGAAVFGLSGQDREYQRELVARLALPFEILSDPALELAAALRLPTFELAGARYYARVTLVLSQGRVAKWFYPVFPPGENAAKVLEWLRGARG